jgi:hypothetical protein
MRFKTGFVVGCATGLYLTRKVRQLQGPLAGRRPISSPSSQWLRQSGPSLLSSDVKAEKVLALGDLARQRARDLLRGPMGNLARERVIALFEDAIATQRAETARRN